MDKRILELRKQIKSDPYNAKLFISMDRILRRSGAVEELENIENVVLPAISEARNDFIAAARGEVVVSNFPYTQQMLDRSREVIKTLRNLHKRIKRSRRTRLFDLGIWAEQVVEEENIDFDVESFVQEFNAFSRSLQEELWNEIKKAQERKKELIFYMWPEKGSELIEWTTCDTYTYSTQPNPGYYVRMCVEDDLAKSKALGFTSESETENRERTRSYGWGGRSIYSPPSYVERIKSKLHSEMDAKILRQKVSYFRDFWFDDWGRENKKFSKKDVVYSRGLEFSKYMEKFGSKAIGL